MNRREVIYVCAVITGFIMLCGPSYGQATLDIYGRHDINIRERRDSSQDMLELNNQFMQNERWAEQQRLEREQMKMQQSLEQERLRQQAEYQRKMLQIERDKLELQQRQQEQKERMEQEKARKQRSEGSLTVF